MKTSCSSIRLFRILPLSVGSNLNLWIFKSTLIRHRWASCKGGMIQKLHVLISRKFAAFYGSMITYKQLFIHPFGPLISPLFLLYQLPKILLLAQHPFNLQLPCLTLLLANFRMLLSALTDHLAALPMTHLPPLPWHMHLRCFFQYHDYFEISAFLNGRILHWP